MVDVEDRPTLLMLGEGEPMRAGLEEALARHATFAEAADAASPVAAVMAAAPDLVVLVGDAVRDHEAILKKLAGNALTSVVPVVLLTPGGLDVQLSAARRGVAVVRRTASVDEMAGRIAQLARELPERPAKTGGSVEEATLGELLEIVQRELQGGILSVTQEGGEGSARFVLKPGRNVDAAIRDFVRRIKPLLQQEKPLHYELDDPGTGKLAVLDEADVGDRGVFRGRRVLLVEDDAAAADALAQELRAHGATVAVCTSAGGGLERARTLDPEVVLIDEAALDGETWAVLQQIRRDLGLRWASILVVRLTEVLPEGEAPRMDRLAGSFAPLLAADGEIRERVATEEGFETRLEALGPSRLLHALAEGGQTLHVLVRHPRANVEVSIAEGLVAGAEALPMGDAARRVAGTAALATLLALGSGRVRVERREAPATANLLMPVRDAMVSAAQEAPPIRPSLPAPKQRATATPPAGVLLGELKRILGRLRDEAGVPQDLLQELQSAEVVLDGPAAAPRHGEGADAEDEPTRKRSIQAPKLRSPREDEPTVQHPVGPGRVPPASAAAKATAPPPVARGAAQASALSAKPSSKPMAKAIPPPASAARAAGRKPKRKRTMVGMPAPSVSPPSAQSAPGSGAAGSGAAGAGGGAPGAKPSVPPPAPAA
ncbi:MAG TPA: hypothetical protein RMG95_17955, partial [Polyangiaceae bacterium LLY-WYZ-15_(1-7)]|nr:hypothetical protein [Polyangiaceae bacterium LLY-WYZ-15_(1-7)]